MFRKKTASQNRSVTSAATGAQVKTGGLGRRARRRRPIPNVSLRRSGKRQSRRSSGFTHTAMGVDGTC